MVLSASGMSSSRPSATIFPLSTATAARVIPAGLTTRPFLMIRSIAPVLAAFSTLVKHVGVRLGAAPMHRLNRGPGEAGAPPKGPQAAGERLQIRSREIFLRSRRPPYQAEGLAWRYVKTFGRYSGVTRGLRLRPPSAPRVRRPHSPAAGRPSTGHNPISLPGPGSSYRRWSLASIETSTRRRAGSGRHPAEPNVHPAPTLRKELAHPPKGRSGPGVLPCRW